MENLHSENSEDRAGNFKTWELFVLGNEETQRILK